MARILGDAALGLGSEVGAPAIDGVDPAVLSFPAFAGGEALTIKPALGAASAIDAYVLGFDIYIPQPTSPFTSLLQTGSGDGDLFLRDNGDGTAGLGVSGVYEGAIAYDQWVRVVITVSQEGGETILRKYVDGAEVGTQNLGASDRWDIDPAAGLQLFADNDGETAAGFVSGVVFAPDVPPAENVAAALAAIPTANAAGFFPAPVLGGAIEIDFANDDLTPRYGAAEVSLDGFGFSTPVAIGDSVVGFASQLLAPLPDGDAQVLQTQGFAPSEGLAATIPLEADDLSTYTAVWDLYIASPPAGFQALLQTNPANSDDGDLFIRSDGGLGVGGVYDGSVPIGAWTRIAITVTDQGDGSATLSKYIDGALVGTQTVDAARFTLQSNSDVLLLTDNDGETGPAAIAHFGLSPTALTDAEVSALGGVDADGPFALGDQIQETRTVFWTENFDGLAAALQPAADEGIDASVLGWTHTPPDGFTRTVDAPQGTTEWQGWSFATPAFWTSADGQARDEFTKGVGVIAIADGDEWDDFNGGSVSGNDFNTTFSTGPISLEGVGVVGDANTLTLSFDSHWRPFDAQTGLIEASIDGGDPIELLRLDSATTNDVDDRNRTYEIDFDVAAGAESVELTFSYLNADNDWWWAVDNLALAVLEGEEPAIRPVRLTEEVNFQTGGVFTKDAVDVAGLTFESQFSFRIVTTEGAIADGITFQIQTERPDESLLGPTAGGFLGLPEGPFPGVTIAFDTWQNTEFGDGAPNQIRLFVGDDADVAPVAVIDAPVLLGSGDTYRAWVEYDGASLAVFLSDTDVKPAEPILNEAVDLAAVLGDTAKFGFSGATGGSTSIHDVLSWELSTNDPDGPSGQLLSIDQDAVDLLGAASRLAPLTFDKTAPLQLGFEGGDARVEFGFADAEIRDAPTVTNPIADTLIDQTGDGLTFDLAAVFGDGASNFAVVSSNGETVDAQIVDGVLTLSPGALGHADITVTATSLNGATLQDDFRAIVAGPNAYVFAVIPDTQDYTSNPSISETFGNMTDWLLAQQDSLAIQHAIHVGDIVQFGAVSQWEIAEEAMERLDGRLPYSLAVGNHDQQRPGFSSAFSFETDIDSYFTQEQVGATPEQGGGVYDGFDVGPDTFANGDAYSNSIRNAYSTQTTPDGTQWLIMSLEFGMPDDVLRWASEVIEAHLDHQVIINTHSWQGGDGRVTPTTEPLNTDNDGWGYAIRDNPRSVNGGEDAWRELASKYPNIAFTFNGHNFMGGAETTVSYAAGDDPVHQVFVNYQNGAWRGVEGVGTNGGNGAIRLMVIDPDNDRVTTHTKLTELDTFFNDFPDHEEVFDGLDLGTPKVIAIAKAGGTEVVKASDAFALDPSETLLPEDGLSRTYEWYAADGEKLGETDGAALEVDLPVGLHRLTLVVTDELGNVSKDAKTVIVESDAALLSDTFDDGDLGQWGGAPVAPDFFAFGDETSFGQPTIDPAAEQIELVLSFASSWRPFDNQTGSVAVSYDGGPAIELLRYDSANTNDVDQRNEIIEIPFLAPASASEIEVFWRYDDADNDWWWAIDDVALRTAEATTFTEVWSENFDGLASALQPAVDEAIDGSILGWTHTPPEGFSRTVDAPQGTTEWQGWSFATPAFWTAADGQARDQFTKGTGVIAIADGDEWDDFNGGSVSGNDFNTTFSTGAISLAGTGVDATAQSLRFSFDSHWRPFDQQTGLVEVRIDGGDAIELVRLDSASTNDTGDRNRTYELDFDVAAGAETVEFTFSYLNADNDWWWAVDNLALSVAEPTTLLAENFDGLAENLQPAVDEGVPVLGWTHDGPDGWSRTVDADMPQGTTEWRGWSFTTPEFWATAGGQARDQFTNGAGVIVVADGDEWDDFNGGAAGNADSFDSTLGSVATSLLSVGGGQGVGEAAGVVRVDALAGDEGVLVTPSASGQFNSYTLLFDVLLSPTTQTFTALIQTDVTNSGDADIYLRNDGASASIGISGDYAGALTYGEWGRIALVFETDESGQQTLSKYLDGVFLDSQVVDSDVSNGSRWTLDADAGFLLFSEPNGFTSEIYANAFAFTPEVLDAAAIAAIGGVDVDGPLAGSDDPDAFQLNFDGAFGGLDFGSASVEAFAAGGGESSIFLKGSIFGNPDGAGEAAAYAQSNGANEILLWNAAEATEWSDYMFEFAFEPADNDTVGALFYYADENNYYELALDQQNDTRTLTRVKDGVSTVLATESGSYRHFADQQLKIAVLGDAITITLDEDLLFDGPVTDADPLSGGAVGLLARSMDRVAFDNVTVNPVELSARALGVDPTQKWAIDQDGDGLGQVALTAAASLSAAGVASYAWLVDGEVVATAETASLDLPTGETTVTLRVTDLNGDVAQDQMTVSVAPKGAILALDSFSDGAADGWTIVDEGDIDGPSDWQVLDGAFVQTSNINSTQQGTGSGAFSIEGDGPYLLRAGTFAVYDDPEAMAWTDYAVSATLTPNDDDGIGLLFRYQDPNNYYKLEADAQTGLIMMIKKVEGRETILARGWNEYTPGEPQAWRVEAKAGVLTAYIDGVEVFGSEIDDRAFDQGTVALYGWGSENLVFDDVSVVSLVEPKAVVSLYDATTDELIRALSDGEVIRAQEIFEKSVTFVAEIPAGGALDGRVQRAELDLNDGAVTRVESAGPYALFGDGAGDFGGSDRLLDDGLLTAGENTLSVAFFDAPDAAAFETLELDFTLIDDASAVLADDFRFALIDADTDAEIVTLTDGGVYDAALIDGKEVTVAAFLDDAFWFDRIDSATLNLNGAVERTENLEPYALFGDRVTDGVADYSGEAEAFLIGEANELTLTAYSDPSARGEELGRIALTFSFIGDEPL